ncbi:MAG: nucleoside recognition protein, partial [Desulfobacterales bacterium]|nr:nucleoside recognition protein [Desulfobacterales bacterium]
MAHKKSRPKYAALIVSLSFSALILVIGMITIEGLTGAKVLSRLLWPLTRLMFFICVGLVVGQIIEASGWTRMLATLAAPLFRFGNLGNRCAAAFTAAFFSGVAANAMLLDFYKDGKITR